MSGATAPPYVQQGPSRGCAAVQVCRVAPVQGWTPHSARHAMGKHIVAKTGNIAAVQQQLGHRQAAYAMQYARTTTEELVQVLDDR